MPVLRRLEAFYRPHLGLLYVSLALMGLYAAGLLVTPYLTEHVVNGLVRGESLARLWPTVLALPTVAAVAGLFGFLQQYVGQEFGQRCTFDLRQALYERLQRHDFTYYDQEHTGNLMQRLTGDVESFRMFLTQGTRNAASFAYNFSFAIVVMLSLSWKLTLISFSFFPILAFLAVRFDRRVRPAYSEIRRSMSRMQTVVQESIMGMRTLKSFAREAYALSLFDQENETYRVRSVRAVDVQARYEPLMQLVANLGVVALLAVGGMEVLRGQLSLGALVAFLGVMAFLVGPVQELGWLVNLYSQAGASEERLVQILRTPDRVTDRTGARPLYPGERQGTVELVGVTMRYPRARRATLEDVSLSVEAGMVLGILGRTGAGKSTLVSLIPRFYDPTQGQVRVAGRDVREWTLSSLRRYVGLVPNDTFLFSATIWENIAYGHPRATLEEVRRAARLAQAEDFIEALPQGYHTVIGERGLGLSGGQRQRLALARALLYDPPILILDDATSSLDMETELRLLDALEEAMRGRTTILIAHRVAALRRAHRIVVLDGGRVVAEGTHEELVRRPGLYREVYLAQTQHTPQAGAGVSAGGDGGGG